MTRAFAIAQLRHLYEQLLRGAVGDQAQAARGLLGPAIEALEATSEAVVSIPIRPSENARPGGGKYDAEATAAMLATDARALLLCVVDGNRGSGFSIQLQDVSLLPRIAEVLRKVAADLERAGHTGPS